MREGADRMEKYVNRSTGVLLQPAQESVAAMLARDPMWAICTPEPEPEPEPKPEPESEPEPEPESEPEPAKTRKGKASKEE